MSEEKGTLNGEIHDLKDMLEVKERKINVLQKKVIFPQNCEIFFFFFLSLVKLVLSQFVLWVVSMS